jgi:hypothetical protein
MPGGIDSGVEGAPHGDLRQDNAPGPAMNWDEDASAGNADGIKRR